MGFTFVRSVHREYCKLEEDRLFCCLPICKVRKNMVESQEKHDAESGKHGAEPGKCGYCFSIKKALLSNTHLLVYYSICHMTTVSTCAKYVRRDLTKVHSILC
jgi:hypothetical protein